MPLTGQTAPKVLASYLLGAKENCRGNVEKLHTEGDGEAAEKHGKHAQVLPEVDMRWQR